MKLTSKRAAVIINRYEKLEELAHQFSREKHPNGRHGPIRISNEGIEEEINTACHCHPEYEWINVASLQEFGEWLDKQN